MNSPVERSLSVVGGLRSKVVTATLDRRVSRAIAWPHPGSVPTRGRKRTIAVLIVAVVCLAGWIALPPGASPFVHRCGMRLCVGDSPFVIQGATAYGTYDRPATEVELALKAHLNTLAIVEFETKHHSLSDAMSAATWTRVDRFIATAKTSGLHVILTLSSYAQSLQSSGLTPTRTDWYDYLAFIANRINTVTGVSYKDEPTIAMVQIWGEACFPGESDSTCPVGTSGTAAEMVNFYHRTLNEWNQLAPNILVTTGGFSHLNGPNSSGIPWQTIMSDPADPVCELEVNSQGDLSGSVNKVTSFCKQLGKPWYLAAWSSCYADPGYPIYTATDSAMAQHAQDMYDVGRGGVPATMPAVGTSFWNLKDTDALPGRCDISPAFPKTFHVVQSNRP